MINTEYAEKKIREHREKKEKGTSHFIASSSFLLLFSAFSLFYSVISTHRYALGWCVLELFRRIERL